MNLKDDIKTTRENYSKKGHIFEQVKYKSEQVDVRFIGNYAKHDLNTIVYAYSVGFKKLYSKYLERVTNWLLKGIENKEHLYDVASLEFHQYRLTSALAFATWLNTDINNIELWKNTLVWQEELHSKEDYSKGISRVDKEFIALSIIHYIQAQEYEKGIQFYQSIYGDKLFKLNSNMSGLKVAYAYCLHFYEGKFTVEQLEKAAKPFLEKHLVMLYTMGRSTEMLYWLKTVCDAREKDYTPEEVIYTFYEYIPEEEKPDFVKELLGEKEPEKKSFFSSWFKW